MKKILLFTITALIFVPSVTFAQRYLVDLPIGNDPSFDKYINMLYKMSISVAALLAVIKIIIAGAKYMLSDVVTNKSEAKKDIKGALLGLLLIIGAVIILNTINPALSDGGLNIRKIQVPKLNITAPVSPAPVQPAAGAQGGGGTAPTGEQVNVATEAANSVATQGGAAPTQTSSGCGQKDASNSTYTITVVTVSGCSSTQIGTTLIAGLERTCKSTGGSMAKSGNPVVSAACAVPIPKATAAPVDIESIIVTCTKDGGEKKQGTITYHYFDLSSCGQYLNQALTSLRAACSPNAVFNSGGGSYYCKM